VVTSRNRRRASIARTALPLIQAIVLPLLCISPIAALLILVAGLDPSERLTRGVLYASLFLNCVIIGYRKYSLAGIGITSNNIRHGFVYAIVVFIAALAFMFALQSPKGIADIDIQIWSAVLFYLAVALAEETWFRGLIFKALQCWRGSAVAVLGSALLFGLMHVPTYGWQGLLFSLSIGLPYAVVRLRTSNILGLILIHWLTNLSESFVRISSPDIEMLWIVLLHVLVFLAVSMIILMLDKWLCRKGLLRPDSNSPEAKM